MNVTENSAKKEQEAPPIPLVKPKIEDFVIQEVVGIGNFGKVHKALNQRDNRVVALKMLLKESVAVMKQIDHIISEKDVLNYLSQFKNECPFIMDIFSSF